MAKLIERPEVDTSSSDPLILRSRFPEGFIEIHISREAVDDAFQLTTPTDDERRQAIDENLDTIWHIASEKFAKHEVKHGPVVSITLEAGDLMQEAMHLSGDVAGRAAD